MKILKVKNLSFNYHDKNVFKNISFEVEKGDFACVVGTNGSGKSTLLKIILNILKPVEGEVILFNEPSTKFVNFKKISYISQKAVNFNQAFPATVEEVVSAGLYSLTGFFKRPSKEQKKMVDKCIEQVGLSAYKKKLIGNLSGGQQQRTFIARALVNEPEIIFLDEPTVGIDPEAVKSICCILGSLNALGITIFMVTHDISSILHHSNKILYFSEKNSFNVFTKDEFNEKILQNKKH